MNALNRIWISGGISRGGISRGCCVLLACLAAPLGAGCTARVYAADDAAYPAGGGDDAVVYVDTVPPNIEAYPHYEYGGGEAYYVDGRWYRRGPRGWGYYRQEPPVLQRQRVYVQQAPEARGSVRVEQAPVVRERQYVQQAPAARERPYVQQAPEARERPYVQQAPEAPRRAAPAPRRPAPPEKRGDPHEDHH